MQNNSSSSLNKKGKKRPKYIRQKKKHTKGKYIKVKNVSSFLIIANILPLFSLKTQLSKFKAQRKLEIAECFTCTTLSKIQHPLGEGTLTSPFHPWPSLHGALFQATDACGLLLALLLYSFPTVLCPTLPTPHTPKSAYPALPHNATEVNFTLLKSELFFLNWKAQKNKHKILHEFYDSSPKR